MTENVKTTEKIRFIKDDLTAMDVEAFVFYARPDLTLGSGYGNAISTRGGPDIKKELEQIGSIKPTEAVATSAGELKAKKIIHAAGPVFREEELEKKLAKTIDNALICAEENSIKQIAFPLMGIGFYGITPDASIKIMIGRIKSHLANNSAIEEVIICANDNREFRFLEKNQKEKV